MPDSPSPSLPRRLAALLYDTCLVLPLIMASTALVMAVLLGITGESGSAEDVKALNANIVRALALLAGGGWWWVCLFHPSQCQQSACGYLALPLQRNVGQ